MTTPVKIIFLLILSISVVVRINQVDFPLSWGFAWGDGTRDYLVANHIVKYGEFPLLGPYNLFFDNGIYNSPLYFYILAGALYFYNHVLTLAVLAILLQLSTIVLIFAITKHLFGKTAALLAAAFYSFNPQVLQTGVYVWQPNLMESVAYLSLFILITQKKHFRGWVFVLFAVAFTLHNSAFPALPIFLWYTRYYLKGIFFFAATVTTLYLSVIFFTLTSLSKIDFAKKAVLITSFRDYLNNFLSNANQLLDAFGLVNQYGLVLALLVVILLYFFKIRDTQSRKKLTFLMLALFIAPVVLASFFNKIRPHYLILSLGAFSIFISQVITALGYRGRLYFLASLIVAILFFKALTADFAFIKEAPTALTNSKMMDNIILKVEDELIRIQNDEGLKNFGFFQVRSYAFDKTDFFYYPVMDTILLASLEDRLNQKLTKISDDSPYNHVQIGGKKYLLVVCYEFVQKGSAACLEEFTKENAAYQIIKPLYNIYPVSIFVAQNRL